jgi:hypothetical protein
LDGSKEEKEGSSWGWNWFSDWLQSLKRKVNQNWEKSSAAFDWRLQSNEDFWTFEVKLQYCKRGYKKNSAGISKLFSVQGIGKFLTCLG